MVFFPQSDSICKIRLRMCEPKNPRRSTPPTTSHATPPGHIPFTHHQPHLNSHPTRNTPSHLPAQRLPPKSAIKHHHRHSQQQATSSTTPPSHIRETSQTTPSATPCPTPPATSVIRHYQWHPRWHVPPQQAHRFRDHPPLDLRTPIAKAIWGKNCGELMSQYYDSVLYNVTMTFMFGSRNTWNVQHIAQSDLSDAKHTGTTTFLFGIVVAQETSSPLRGETYGMRTTMDHGSTTFVPGSGYTWSVQ